MRPGCGGSRPWPLRSKEYELNIEVRLAWWMLESPILSVLIIERLRIFLARDAYINEIRVCAREQRTAVKTCRVRNGDAAAIHDLRIEFRARAKSRNHHCFRVAAQGILPRGDALMSCAHGRRNEVGDLTFSRWVSFELRYGTGASVALAPGGGDFCPSAASRWCAVVMTALRETAERTSPSNASERLMFWVSTKASPSEPDNDNRSLRARATAGG